MNKRTRRVEHPILLAILMALLVLSAKLGHAQTPTKRVPVATRAMARGTVIGASDFAMRVTTVRGIADTSSAIVGWVTRRAIAAGEVLRTPAIEAPNVVTANQAVQVEWQDRDVRLTLRGIATRNASIGERIAVRTDSGRRMEATVVAPGRVRLD